MMTADLEVTHEAADEQRERLLRMESQAALDRKQTKSKLYLDYADGLPIDFNAMQRLGLTVLDLDNAQSKILADRQKREAINKVAIADAEIVRLKSAIADEVRARDAMIEEFDSRIRAMETECEIQRRLVSVGNDARREMVRECTNPDALAAVARIDNRLAAIQRELVDTSKVLTAKRDARDSCRGRTEPELGQRFERLSGEVSLLEQRRKALEDQIREVTAERSAAELEWLCDPHLV